MIWAVLTSSLLVGALCGSHVAAATPKPDGGGSGGTSAATRPGAAEAASISFPVRLATSSRPVCLESWAGAERLAIHWAAGQQWAKVTGSPTNIGRAFHVVVDEYRSSDGRRAFTANHSPEIPIGVCGEVTGTGVIHSYQRPTDYDVPGGGLLPQQVLQAYDAEPLANQGLKGQGETIVLFESDGFRAQDLRSFVKLLPSGSQTPIDVQVVGGNPAVTSGSPSESDLDIEAAHGIAPEAKIVYINLGGSQFQNDTTSQTFIDAFQMADTNWPGAIWSVSLGWCETDSTAWNSTDLLNMANAVGAAEAHGTTMFAASGDSGGLDCEPPGDGGQVPQQSFVGVSVPADLPTVTGVGGTTLSTTSNGTYVGETTWSEPLLSQGTGGGVSSVFARPAWQTGLGTGQYDNGNARQVPDVAAVADPQTGVVVYDGGQKVSGGGTSLATPLWAGFTSLIDQYLQKLGGHRVGFFNQMLYALADGSPPNPPFHDITVGGNNYYPATPGYDMTTGLGSPDVWNLARDLAASEGLK